MDGGPEPRAASIRECPWEVLLQALRRACEGVESCLWGGRVGLVGRGVSECCARGDTRDGVEGERAGRDGGVGGKLPGWSNSLRWMVPGLRARSGEAMVSEGGKRVCRL